MLTNVIHSFEQLGPGILKYSVFPPENIFGNPFTFIYSAVVFHISFTLIYSNRGTEIVGISFTLIYSDRDTKNTASISLKNMVGISFT